MSVFADASALVKLYADEGGADVVCGLDFVVVSALSWVEVPAAIWRKHRLGELSADDARLLVTSFEADLFGTSETEARFAAVSVNGDLLDLAARVVAVHGVRAYDAVQLATAMAARSVLADCHTMAVFDAALRRAASTEGFEVLPGP